MEWQLANRVLAPIPEIGLLAGCASVKDTAMYLRLYHQEITGIDAKKLVFKK